MPSKAVLAIANSKGGTGKSTVGINLALEFAQVVQTTLIDADPNQPITTWASSGNVPDNLKIVTSHSERDILDAIDQASEVSDIVIVDLEGVGSRRLSYALSRADLVLIPTQEQKPDVDQAAKVINEIMLEEKRDGRAIPYVGVFTRTRVVAKSRTARMMADQITSSGALPMLKTELNERDAYAAVWAYGVPLRDLDPGQVNNIPAAVANVTKLCEEVVVSLHEQSTDLSQERKIA